MDCMMRPLPDAGLGGRRCAICLEPIRGVLTFTEDGATAHWGCSQLAAIFHEMQAERRHQRRVRTRAHMERFRDARARRQRPPGSRPPPRLRRRCREMSVASQGLSTVPVIVDTLRDLAAALVALLILLRGMSFSAAAFWRDFVCVIAQPPRAPKTSSKPRGQLPTTGCSEHWRRNQVVTDMAYVIWQCLCVPFCCGACTAWFFAILVRVLARFFLGPREYEIWSACLREWVVGFEYFFVVLIAACTCVYSFVIDLGYFVLAAILPTTCAEFLVKLCRPACLSAWAWIGCSVADGTPL